MIVDHPWFECIISLAILVTCRSMDIPMVHGLSWELPSQVNSVMLGVESQMSLDHRDIAWSKCFVCISADEKL